MTSLPPAGVRALGPMRRHCALLGSCLAALGLAGCGSATAVNNAGVTVSGSTLAIVVSEPPAGSGGQVANDVLDAERLAFSQSGAKAGAYHLVLDPVRGDEVSQAARDAVSNKTAIAYLGEIAPGTSGVSAQITNELGLLQVSPTDTAAFLTKAVPGVKHSPQHFYPAHSSFHETFGRVVPTTIAEAAATAARMKQEGVTRLAVENDGTNYGTAVAEELRGAATRAGITATAAAPGAASGAGAVFFAGLPGPVATKALDAAAGSSSVKLFAPSALYDDAFVSGLSAAAQHALTVSAPGFLPRSLDAVGTAYETAFQSRYGHAPAPQAIFGYEAMRAVIASLDEAGSHAPERSVVVADFRDLHRSAAQSAVGSYALSNGDINIAPFVFARVSNGTLVPSAEG